MDGAQTGLKAKDAIDAGFKYFKEFFDGKTMQNVLLEGLEYHEKDELWTVTIGFDLTRTKENHDSLGLFGAMLVQKEQYTSRESREFTIRDADGSCVRMRTP